MCKTGGKRCDTHKDGSKATVTLTSKITAVQEAIVRKIFVILKKEGKGLDAPAHEEVVSYAETGKFLTKYNPDITERQKKSLMRQFEKSKQEEPSGPLFHAWKHTMPEVVRRTRKTMMATGLAAGILMTSACGGNPGGNTLETTAPPTTAPTTIAATTAPSAEPSMTAIPGTVINGMPTKKELASNSKGEYIQTTISPNDPAFKFNPATVDQSASVYSPEEMTAVQKQVATFVAEETIDSNINGTSNPKDLQGWWNKNKDKFDTSSQQEMHDVLMSNDTTKAIVFRAQFREGKYDLNYGKDAVHVTSRSMTPTKILGGTLKGKEAMSIDFDINFSLAAKVDGKVVNENTSGIASYTMLKDPASGKWFISGFNNTFNTTSLK